MKKRIGKINTDAIVFSNTDKTAEKLLELFLQEKQAFNLSSETISLYRYHCMQFLQSLGIATKIPIRSTARPPAMTTRSTLSPVRFRCQFQFFFIFFSPIQLVYNIRT